ncbi:MAG TPA: hypothetical protein VGM67_19625 [Gemmatimonadaceae bacterium]|jgi:hypothetical protein
MIPVALLFDPWQSFYVIVGSSGAALTGLQFVVMALIADARHKGNADTVDAFGTPTVVHFCIALVTAAVISAPWPTLLPPVVVLTLIGLGGVGYAIIVTLRARQQQDYKPVLEDWIWHSMLPLIAYVTFLCGAIVLGRGDAAGLFAIGASTLLLLLIGIHNAWDSVAYVTTSLMGDSSQQK